MTEGPYTFSKTATMQRRSTYAVVDDENAATVPSPLRFITSSSNTIDRCLRLLFDEVTTDTDTLSPSTSNFGDTTPNTIMILPATSFEYHQHQQRLVPAISFEESYDDKPSLLSLMMQTSHLLPRSFVSPTTHHHKIGLRFPRRSVRPTAHTKVYTRTIPPATTSLQPHFHHRLCIRTG